MAKYLAELDFRMRCQNGETPSAAWDAVTERLAELLDTTGYNLTFFTPELNVLREQMMTSPRSCLCAS
ncbi:hypothetical protein GO986_00145 [Deinococcus sp. HMF7620]|uniref:Uncharacterized protein n=1 Tax=Deinococcus arboris TaxID=2682977 RepID=A0A7C9LQY7_9DEIO|nr:hypothetical protein [Deinococcus arboris]MVN85180.1 hypothetical protein [Deinococcus arboris]